MTEDDEMVGWHHQVNGHEFEQTPGYGEGQGSLTGCSPGGCKEKDTTERLDENNKRLSLLIVFRRLRKMARTAKAEMKRKGK